MNRWANSASPAYGALSDHQTMRRHAGEKRQEKAKAAWGSSLSSPADIVAVFAKYAAGAFPVCVYFALDLRVLLTLLLLFSNMLWVFARERTMSQCFPPSLLFRQRTVSCAMTGPLVQYMQ